MEPRWRFGLVSEIITRSASEGPPGTSLALWVGVHSQPRSKLGSQPTRSAEARSFSRARF